MSTYTGLSICLIKVQGTLPLNTCFNMLRMPVLEAQIGVKHANLGQVPRVEVMINVFELSSMRYLGLSKGGNLVG